jgi:SAM-dependent methyltransferase
MRQLLVRLRHLGEKSFRATVAANMSASRRAQERLRLPDDKPLWGAFGGEADRLLRALPDGATVLDLGGGQRFVYRGSVQPAGRLRVVAVDVSAEELALNQHVTETQVADVAAGLPFPDASADLILSRALLEHVNGVPAAIGHMGRVLKPGGTALHLVPCRYSLFGLAGRLLPFGPLLALTHAVMPDTRGQVEFPVVYDNCWPQAMDRAFRQAGFCEVDIQITWACPGYFEAVFPLFVLHGLWALTMSRLRARKMAAYMVVRAVR